MDTRTEQFTPDYIVTPGEILEETLDARGIKKREFAERCGRTAKMISEIIAGKAAITPETALQFERVLGVSASLWSNLESRYRLKLAAKEEAEKLQKHVGIAKNFPINDLVKLGFIRKSKDAIEQLSSLLRFFGVGNVEALDSFLDIQKSYYRNSKSFKSDKHALSAWLRCGQIKAEEIDTKPYDLEIFKHVLKDIRPLTKLANIDDSIYQAQQLCAHAGVALVLMPELKNTCLSGVARWLNKDKALIQLSLRHKSDDHLWFTFFHEAAHIILHGKKDLFIDETDQNINEVEKEADDFAQNALISKDVWKEFILTYSEFTERIVKDFSDEQNISPGIVVGRLQHQKLIHFSKLNSLKIRYVWKLKVEGM